NVEDHHDCPRNVILGHTVKVERIRLALVRGTTRTVVGYPQPKHKEGDPQEHDARNDRQRDCKHVVVAHVGCPRPHLDDGRDVYEEYNDDAGDGSHNHKDEAVDLERVGYRKCTSNHKGDGHDELRDGDPELQLVRHVVIHIQNEHVDHGGVFARSNLPAVLQRDICDLPLLARTERI